jgi:hypothetical protein
MARPSSSESRSRILSPKSAVCPASTLPDGPSPRCFRAARASAHSWKRAWIRPAAAITSRLPKARAAAAS